MPMVVTLQGQPSWKSGRPRKVRVVCLVLT